MLLLGGSFPLPPSPPGEIRNPRTSERKGIDIGSLPLPPLLMRVMPGEKVDVVANCRHRGMDGRGWMFWILLTLSPRSFSVLDTDIIQVPKALCCHKR